MAVLNTSVINAWWRIFFNLYSLLYITNTFFSRKIIFLQKLKRFEELPLSNRKKKMMLLFLKTIISKTVANDIVELHLHERTNPRNISTERKNLM